MKIHTIKTPTAELLIIELPIGWDYEHITDDKTFIYHKTEDGTNDHHIEGYTLLGTPDEVSEEDARELVKKMPFSSSDRYLDYTPYIYYPNHFNTAKESLFSLLESEIFWENPLGEKHDIKLITSHKSEIARQYLIASWHEAEQKTFDRNRTIIFKKKI